MPFMLVIASAIIVVLVSPALAEKKIEHWTCGEHGCGAFYSWIDDRCNRLSITADISEETGTVQIDELPKQQTEFWLDGLVRVWAWAANDSHYSFQISPDYTGGYFHSGANKPNMRFSCIKAD